MPRSENTLQQTRAHSREKSIASLVNFSTQRISRAIGNVNAPVHALVEVHVHVDDNVNVNLSDDDDDNDNLF